jgi:hypothetical protein
MIRILSALLPAFLLQSLAYGQFIRTLPLYENIICAGGSVDVSFEHSDDFQAGQLIVEISDQFGNFNNARQIGRLTKAGNISVKCSVPEDLQESATYRIRVVSLDPPLTGFDNGENVALKIPEKPVFLTPTNSCIGENPIKLKGEPSGGYFSGLGVVNDVFIPGLAGEGRHFIHYSYLSSAGCILKASSSITVKNCNPVFGADMEDQVIIIPVKRKVLITNSSDFLFDKVNIYDTSGKLIRSKSASELNKKKPVFVRWLKKNAYILELSSFKGSFKKRFYVW